MQLRMRVVHRPGQMQRDVVGGVDGNVGALEMEASWKPPLAKAR